MKNTISLFFLVSLFLAIGCSTSKKSKAYGNVATNDLTKDASDHDIIHYHVSTKATKNKTYTTLIDDQFSALENLASRFAKVHYNKKDARKYDCEIEILFDELTIKDEEAINNKHFSKVVKGEQLQSDDGPTRYSETVSGYVHQRKKLRKLKWEIIIKTNADSSHCQSTINSFTESLISRSVDNTLSGDERAISKKYKTPIGPPLLSREVMIHEAINNAYEKIEHQLKAIINSGK